jgi:hypothetical protein
MNQQITTKNRKEISTQITNLTDDIVFSVMFGFLFFVGVLILMTIPERYQAEVAFRSRALLTTGIIMETKKYQSCYSSSYSSNCTTKYDMKVKFRSNTGNSEMFWESRSEKANKNQSISVLYDPKEISRARVFYRGDTPKNRAVSELIIGLFFVLVGSFNLLLCKEDLRKS